jgi:2-oxoglutarate ferredoxin oxidoreductase subunit beta
VPEGSRPRGLRGRSFAGDPKQVQQPLKAALATRYGGARIISPCVTFNNSDLSTKGYNWGKEHEEALHEVRYVMPAEEIMVEYSEGEVKDVVMRRFTDRLRKLDID